MGKTLRAPMSPQDLAAKEKAIRRELSLRPATVDFISSSAGSEVVYSLSGLQSLLDNIDELSNVSKDVVGDTMEAVLKEVVDEARFEVPFVSGNLRDSIESDSYVPNSTQQIIEMSVWCGAPNPERFGVNSAEQPQLTEREKEETGAHKVEVDPSEYARRQHEDTTLNHPHGGKAKFVEDPFLRIAPTVVPKAQEALAILTGKGGVNGA